uniref:Uncharacterized protein n=1 Tax=Panagrolaimus davidi TaxID=227884 RepID=A0A914QG89_9BILA
MDLMLLFRNCMTLLSILGILTELFFLFLLHITRKDRTVQSHAAFLAPNCIFDLIFLFSWAPFRVDILVENGYLIIGLTIFNTEISPHLIKAIILILSFSCNLALSVLAIPFYLRFMIIFLQFLKREQMLPSELQAFKTLQKAMIIQCSVQSATLLIPFNAFVIGAYLNFPYIFALFVIFNAAPLLTTFCTIFSISEYRKKFVQWYNEIIDLIMLN